MSTRFTFLGKEGSSFKVRYSGFDTTLTLSDFKLAVKRGQVFFKVNKPFTEKNLLELI